MKRYYVLPLLLMAYISPASAFFDLIDENGEQAKPMSSPVYSEPLILDDIALKSDFKVTVDWGRKVLTIPGATTSSGTPSTSSVSPIAAVKTGGLHAVWVPPTQWIIQAGSLKHQLAQWVRNGHYQRLDWRVAGDYTLTGDAVFQGGRESLLRQLERALRDGGVRITISVNNDIIVVRDQM